MAGTEGREIGTRTSILVVALLAVVAYLPSLGCGFVFDDLRFVERNEAVHHLTSGNLLRYFTDPTTLADHSRQGIYRPLRTLDFAIDWRISGGKAWFFHLRSVIYHALGSILALLVLRELLGKTGAGARGALFGALFFALHPVHTESVAWISSRADTQMLVLFLSALLLHLQNRPVLAAVVLVPALLAKESAVVFVGIAVICDLFRRAPLRFRRYAAYGLLAAAYTFLWLNVLAERKTSGLGQLDSFWGGTYGANLLTMSQGFLLYVKTLLLPVNLVIDYYVPTIDRITPGSAAAILILLVLGTAALVSGARSRFALAWFLVAIFPTSNLLVKISIPTAERFLYLPSIGLALLAGPLLARTRLGYAVLACFLLLTVSRTLDWRSDETLWNATNEAAATPRGIWHVVCREHAAAHRARGEIKTASPSRRDNLIQEMKQHCRETVRAADALIELYDSWIRLPPGPMGSAALSKKANALVLLGQPAEAFEAADAALRLPGDPDPSAWFNAALALEALGRREEAAMNLERAWKAGYDGGGDLRPVIARLWLRVAAQREGGGDRSGALSCYRHAWEALPDPARNADALEGMKRLTR